MKAALKEKFKGVDVHIEKLKQQLELPDKFCNTCTLKEGTWVVLLFYQAVTATFVTCVGCLVALKRDEMSKYWLQRFKDDFDPYINGENMETIHNLHNLWESFTYGLLIIESVYFLLGMVAIYALCDKRAHPGLYLPWLVWTAMLVASNFITAITMVAYAFIVSQYRFVTVTGDMVPALICFLYAGLWAYGLIVVFAHYKRRVIVKWWRDQELKERKQRT